MADEIDWQSATYAGNRRRQHEEFLALPFRVKLEMIEQLGEVVEHFQSRRNVKAAARRRVKQQHDQNKQNTGDAPGMKGDDRG